MRAPDEVSITMQQRAPSLSGHESPPEMGAIVTLGEDGLVDIDFRHCGRITLAVIQEVHQQHLALCPDRKAPVLMRGSHVGRIDYDAQRFGSSASVANICDAMGFVTYSFLERHLVSLFLTHHRPPYPTRVFDDETEPRTWLSGFLDKD